MIKVDGIHKSFGDVRAVRGVSFEAPDGKITGLLGPNGAGKSTTLRVLYTVLKPDEGSASIDGHDVTALFTERDLSAAEGTIRRASSRPVWCAWISDPPLWSGR